MMNKGMIMEIKKNYAIALNEEGIMEKIVSKQNMEVGQKIFYFDDDIVKITTEKSHRYNSFFKSIGSIAALFLLVFTFFQTIKYEDAYAIVSLDINPSIQIEVDSKQMILDVEGVNTDGKNIDFTDIKDVSLNEGIQKIKEKLIEKNYLDTNKEVLVGFAFVKNEDNSNYEENIQDAIKSTFETEKVTVTYVKGDKKAVEEAKTKGISLGRYEASLLADEETKKQIDRAPVKDITSSIKDKENVIQWEAEDKKNKDIPVTNTKPQVENEKPATNKPIINAPSDNEKPNTNQGGDKDKNNKPKDNDVLELEPEVPVQGGKDAPSNNKPEDDNSIIIEPNNGAIENNTTSGKSEGNPSKTPPEPSTSMDNLVNEGTKN